LTPLVHTPVVSDIDFFSVPWSSFDQRHDKNLPSPHRPFFFFPSSTRDAHAFLALRNGHQDVAPPTFLLFFLPLDPQTRNVRPLKRRLSPLGPFLSSLMEKLESSFPPRHHSFFFSQNISSPLFYLRDLCSRPRWFSSFDYQSFPELLFADFFFPALVPVTFSMTSFFSGLSVFATWLARLLF